MSPSEKFPIPGLSSLTKILTALLAILFSLSLVVTPVYPTSTGSSTPIKVNIDGQSTLSIPANRAILSLKIISSGSSQIKVADE